MFDTGSKTDYTNCMHTPPFSPDLTNKLEQPATVAVAEDIADFKRVLSHFIEIGDEFAEMLRQEARQAIQAQAEAAKRHPDPQIVTPQVVPRDIIEAYERITRSVRRSMVLYQKLSEPIKTPPAHDRVAARKKVIRDVEDAIQRKATGARAEILRAELVERLERPEFDDELANRSIGEIVNEMCRDFGIAGLDAIHPWKRRTPQDIAILHARATQVYGQAPSAELAALLGDQTTQNVPNTDDS
jgi:hypothetical protein